MHPADALPGDDQLAPRLLAITEQNAEARIFVRGGFADVTPAGLTILAEEARVLEDVKLDEVQAEMEATLLKIQSLDKDSSERATLQAHFDYLESLKAALVH